MYGCVYVTNVIHLRFPHARMNEQARISVVLPQGSREAKRVACREEGCANERVDERAEVEGEGRHEAGRKAGRQSDTTFSSHSKLRQDHRYPNEHRMEGRAGAPRNTGKRKRRLNRSSERIRASVDPFLDRSIDGITLPIWIEQS